MAKSYAGEMLKLADTLAWASEVDIAPLSAAVGTASGGPLRAIGSGGSLTAARVLAFLHRRVAAQIAAAETPLEAVSEPLNSDVAAWLLSAGGNNVDILAAFNALVIREGRQLAALCGRAASPLGEAAARHAFVDFLAYEPPTGRDGFLATNSLLGFTALLTRAYLAALPGGQPQWSDVVSDIGHLADVAEPEWASSSRPIWDRATTIVLHGGSTRLGALDLESKFTEAALGNLQTADWRNFAHGRHHWLAKHRDSTAVIALISEEDATLAERTLALIPSQVPICSICIPGSPAAAAMGSVIVALRLTGWAGAERSIDPGRPGVPEFGRRLYNLPLPKAKSAPVSGISATEAAAIRRKAGVDVVTLDRRGELKHWRQALKRYQKRLAETDFAGVVLDYDGTLVDLRKRFSGLEPHVVAELERLLRCGVRVAIATGRGASVRRDLQSALPCEVWGRVLIGYYNGADIASLADDSSPDRHAEVSATLRPLVRAFEAHPELAAGALQTVRPSQITLEARREMPEHRLWDVAHQVILAQDRDDVVVTRSSHSIDIIPKGVSKVRVLAKMQEYCGSGELLAIGDRGRWPGNDYELLRGPFALSVDQVSVDPKSAWHLGGPGERGVQVTIRYLRRLQMRRGLLRLLPKPAQ